MDRVLASPGPIKGRHLTHLPGAREGVLIISEGSPGGDLCSCPDLTDLAGPDMGSRHEVSQAGSMTASAGSPSQLQGVGKGSCT